MEIKLFEAADKKKSFTFSSLPEKISGSLGTKYQTYDIISQGAVKVPKGTEVAEISWDAVFFGPDRKNLAVVKAESYQKPDKCIKQLREWQEKGTVLNLLVTETWINMDVTIDSFTPDPFGAYGDVSYGIKFSQAKDLKIYTTNELKIAAFVKRQFREMITQIKALPTRLSVAIRCGGLLHENLEVVQSGRRFTMQMLQRLRRQPRNMAKAVQTMVIGYGREQRCRFRRHRRCEDDRFIKNRIPTYRYG